MSESYWRKQLESLMAFTVGAVVVVGVSLLMWAANIRSAGASAIPPIVAVAVALLVERWVKRRSAARRRDGSA